MKRYTLKFISSDPGIPLDQLRNEVDELLVRLHPRITYKLGPAFIDTAGNPCVEIAADGKRELVYKALKEKTWRLPTQFEGMSWGWSVESTNREQSALKVLNIERDPLEDVEALQGDVQIHIVKSQLHRRYIILMAITGVLLLVFIANGIFPRSPIWEWIYIVCFAFFMFWLSDTPIDIRVYADAITFGVEMLEIRLWMLRTPKTIRYQEIWGLDYNDMLCIIYHANSKTRLVLHERFGCKEKPAVLKTIVQRAGLSYVEGNFRNLVYRKPDAPA